MVLQHYKTSRYTIDILGQDNHRSYLSPLGSCWLSTSIASSSTATEDNTIFNPCKKDGFLVRWVTQILGSYEANMLGYKVSTHILKL